MLRQMPARMLYEWMIFFQLEPTEEQRIDARLGQLVSLLANVYRDEKKHPRPYTFEECAPRFGDDPAYVPQQSWQDMRMIAVMMTALSEGEAARGD